MGHDEEPAICERTDRIFAAVLGRTLATATPRLGIIAVALFAIGAAASMLAS